MGDRKEDINREKKVPKAPFWGRMLPRCFVHDDFTLIRDFLEKQGFETHRKWLLEPER